MSIEDITVYGTQEIASMFNCHRDTVAWWFRTGRLKGYKHKGSGGRRYWRALEKDIKVFLYTIYLEGYPKE